VKGGRLSHPEGGGGRGGVGNLASRVRCSSKEGSFISGPLLNNLKGSH
jgi:hypothetical protein